MKTLVVYYSYSGINKKLAEKIALNLKADFEEIVDLADRKSYLKTFFLAVPKLSAKSKRQFKI
jgi:flavodoxin